MQTEILAANHPKALSRAQHVLQAGGLIAFPTDTVYGLASRIDSAAAIEKLFAAKGRDFNKAIAVLVSDLEQVELVAQDFPPSALRLAQRFWPGALTLVVQRRAGLPEVLSPLPTVGVRMPDHPFARALLRACGPLAVTSANLSGAANPISAADVAGQLSGRIDLILDGGPCPGGVPSSVVDCTRPELPVLRQGALSEAELRAALTDFGE